MSCSIILFLFISNISANLKIVSPQNLAQQFNYQENKGSLKYSVSTFGEILYNQNALVQVLLPEKDNQNGCQSFKVPNNTISRRIVFLVERGSCTYSKQAFLSQEVGAYAVLVYHNNKNVDVENIVPCHDSVCSLKRQQFVNSSFINLK